MPQLPGLVILNLSNTQISSLEGMPFLPLLQTVYLEGTRIGLSDRESPLLSLVEFKEICTKINKDEEEFLLQFLEKIEGTADYKNIKTKDKVVQTIREILKAAELSSKFKDELFALIHESLESCSDRTAIILNQIDLQRRLDSGALDPDLLIGYRRLQLLHEEVSKIIRKNNLRDPIESMLYVQIKLKDDLELPTTTDGMLYEQMASITDEELKKIKEDILTKTSEDQKISILTQRQEETYDNEGKVVAIGDLSPTNPFGADITKIWEEKLFRAFPESFEKIEPNEEEDFENPKTQTAWEQRRNHLISELTRQLVTPR